MKAPVNMFATTKSSAMTKLQLPGPSTNSERFDSECDRMMLLIGH